MNFNFDILVTGMIQACTAGKIPRSLKVDEFAFDAGLLFSRHLHDPRIAEVFVPVCINRQRFRRKHSLLFCLAEPFASAESLEIASTFRPFGPFPAGAASYAVDRYEPE